MKEIKYILSLFIATMLLGGCNQTLEETYDNVTDGGKIRYVAKCSDVRANAGWERLVIDWKNGTDATIDKIKLVWTYDGTKDSVLLDKLTTSHELKELYNTIYRFDIIALDKEGNKSLSETTYGRPYTREHEIMNAFTRGVVKSYFLEEKMVFFADKWNKNITEIKLQYVDTKGVTRYYTFIDKGAEDKENEGTYDNFITIDDVSMDPKDAVYVLRKGRFEGSLDEIEFDPYEIKRIKSFSSGFINAIERRYGFSTDTKEDEVIFNNFVDTVSVLEFDYDIETFEDILYCPKLKKLVFGKNRYLELNRANYNAVSTVSSGQVKSKLVVEKAMELLGVKIDYYWALHYFNPVIKGSENIGKSQLPSLNIIPIDSYRDYDDSEEKVYVSCDPYDPYAILNSMLDNDYETAWETTSDRRLRSYNMFMELNEVTEISGLKFSQLFFNPRQNTSALFYIPASINIQTSADGAVWENVTYFESNIIGNSPGEKTLLKFPEGKRNVKHIKISLQDRVDNNGNFKIIVGDIVLFR